MDDRRLERDFRQALDAVAPPAPWLAASVRAAVREHRNESWIVRTRRLRPVQFRFAMTGLTMVGLAILLAAAILIAQTHFALQGPMPGGHGIVPPPPSASPTMTAADRTTLAQLEARPLHPPSLLPGGVCPADQADPISGNYGTAPVFLAGGPYTGDHWGDYYDVRGYTASTLTGPVLIRGNDIKSPNHPVVFQGGYVAGPVFAQDGATSLYTELVLDTTHPLATTTDVNGVQYTDWGWRQGEKAGWSGCVYFQADGAGFSIGMLVNQGLKNGRDVNYSGG